MRKTRLLSHSFGQITHHLASALVCLMMLVTFSQLTACTDRKPNSPEASLSEAESTPQKKDPTKRKTNKVLIDKGDLAKIQARKTIRYLIPNWEYQTALPRQGLPTNAYRDLATEFAAKLDLTVDWVPVDNLSDLITYLEEGKGDLIVTNLTKTKEREKRIAFSAPFTFTTEHIISSPPALESLESLNEKLIKVDKGSSYATSLNTLKSKNANATFQIEFLKQNADPDAIIDAINAGQYHASVLDDNVAQALKGYREDFAVGLAINSPQAIAWAVRKENPKLLFELNEFITEKLVSQYREKTFTGDLEDIAKRKTLRMITRNSPTSYFMWRGELMGFDYDLVKKFADERKLLLEVIVAPPNRDMLDMLQKGEGDLVAASLSVTEERRQQNVEFTRFYNRIHEQVVTSNARADINTLADLNGRTLFIRKNTAYWETAQALLDTQQANFELIATPDELSTDEILSKVAAGEFDATIADSHLVEIEQTFLDQLKPSLVLENAHEHAWAVRKNNPALLASLNSFIKKKYRGLFFNVTYEKYFKNTKRIGKYQGQRLKDDETLSPYDDTIKALAPQYNFDWRMIVSQMYQESRFDPKAKSFAGARGLLQVMPRTAKELGYALPFKPEEGIEAGIKYLNWTRDRFEKTLPPQERLWFSLAAYNAGFGHVYDARRLAKKKGWDPDKWFGNTEKAMLLLAKRKYFSKARFGYVRGKEPVNYVRKIRDRYQAYLSLQP